MGEVLSLRLPIDALVSRRRALATFAATLVANLLPVPSSAGNAANSSRKRGNRDPVNPDIVIDAGHGGKDPGAISVSDVQEKHFVLAIARELRHTLLATGRYDVLLTRESDVFMRSPSVSI